MKTPIYHVGLLKRGSVAVFQHVLSKDSISCELIEYYGEREGTKEEAKRKLAENRSDILASLQQEHPQFNFTSVRIE
jgi:hypothetical protein